MTLESVCIPKVGEGIILTQSSFVFLENKILVSIFSVHLAVFLYTLQKIIICFSLKATNFFTNVLFFFHLKCEMNDSPEKYFKEIPSLCSFICPKTKKSGWGCESGMDPLS